MCPGRSVEEAWDKASAGDPVSAFEDAIICNQKIDATAAKIDESVLQADSSRLRTPGAKALLLKRKRIISFQLKAYPSTKYQYKTS